MAGSRLDLNPSCQKVSEGAEFTADLMKGLLKKILEGSGEQVRVAKVLKH